MQLKKLLLAVVFGTIVCACTPIQAEKSSKAELSCPPVIHELINTSDREIILTFDKEITADRESFILVPDIEIADITESGKKVIIHPDKPLAAGTEYFIKGTVQDTASNSTTLGVTFYGYNPYIPEIVINEFTTNGSGNHPDMAELFVKAGGNTAGITLYGGTKTTFTDKLVFPPLQVESGDYIIVHFKPEGLAGEINETENKNASTGNDISDVAWDFWIRNGSGLSGNNGVLTLYTNPYGTLIDAVIYTNRTSESDTSYRGFGSTRMLLQTEEICEAGGWKTTGDEVRPEDCVNSAGSTATRSICRNSNSEDNNSVVDWHIVPTSKFSFGKINCDDVYIKPEN